MKTLSPSQKLLFFLIAIHLTLFFIPQLSFSPSLKKDKTPIVVRTRVLSAPLTSVQNTSQIAAPPPTQKKISTPPKEKPVAKETKPQLKKKEKKPSLVSTAPEKTPIKTKKAPPQAKHELLSKLQKNLGKIDTNPSVNLSTLKDPPKPIQLESLHTSSEDEMDLTSCFTFFQESLELPDKGEVKVRMNLLPNGKIDQVQILFAESPENAKYVAATLPTLTLKSHWNKTISLTVTFKGNP